MKFKTEQIQRIIDEELEQSPKTENRWHGISTDNLRDRLLSPPLSKRFVKSWEVGYLWLWVVFDEIPESKTGYLVVYDPREQIFGLALKPYSKKLGSVLGFYGNFKETIESM